MGEVRIHFKNILIALLNGPFKPMNIGRPQTQLTFSFFQKKCTRIFFLKPTNNIRSPVRRTVINDEYVKTLIQGKNSLQDGGNIFLLIVGWYDRYLFQLN